MVFAAAVLHYAHGPYWLGYNFDPDYLYLVNSLALAESKLATTTGHPGTTLQMLGAVILRGVHFFNDSSPDNLANAVLKNPDYYLSVINIVLVCLTAVMLFMIGHAGFRLSGHIGLSLMLQLTPFFSNGLLNLGLLHVSPESLLFISGLFAILVLIKILQKQGDGHLPVVHFYWMVLAVICGFGTASKLNFALLIIVPLCVLSGLRKKVQFLMVALLSFVFWTWPIMPQYKNLFGWYCKIITHQGYYGFGNPGMVDLSTYAYNLIYLFSGEPLAVLIWLMSAAVVIKMVWSSKNRKEIWQDIYVRILCALMIMQLSAYLLFAKHAADRYLIPVVSMSGFMLFLIAVCLKRFNHWNFIKSPKVLSLSLSCNYCHPWCMENL